jgi:hypothetical protein
MSKTIISIAITILITGFIAGFFAGASFKTGKDIDPESIVVNILGSFCSAIPSTSSQASNSCFLSYGILTVCLVIVGIAEIFTTAQLIGDMRIGLFLYGISFIAGFLLVVLN